MTIHIHASIKTQRGESAAGRYVIVGENGKTSGTVTGQIHDLDNNMEKVGTPFDTTSLDELKAESTRRLESLHPSHRVDLDVRLSSFLKVNNNHLTVPYGPVQRQQSTNHGFVDLKTNPHRISTVPELQGYPEFEELIRAINGPNTPVRSLGCEKSVSSYSDPNEPHLSTKLASYVEIGFVDLPKNQDVKEFERLVNDFAGFYQSKGIQIPQYSIGEFELTATAYANLGPCWSLCSWAGGFGVDEQEARNSWASLIAPFRDYFAALP